MDNRTLLEKLIAIQVAINDRIKLASNRYEEYETCAIDADQDEVDRKFFEHEKRHYQEFFKFYVFEQINTLYHEYLEEHDIKTNKPEDRNHVEKIRDLILSQGVKICSGFEKVHTHLGKKSEINFDLVNTYLQENIETMLATLCSGRKLEIEDKDFSTRFNMDLRLAHERNLRDINLLNMGPNSFVEMALDDSHKQRLKKSAYLFNAMYIDQTGTTVGYCDEHAILAIKKILELEDLDREITIEKISVRYEEGDGHTFIAIKRKPESKLSNIAEWGPDAILFDAWNKIVCMAKDFNSLPIYYFSYPDAADWSVDIKFTRSDYNLLNTLHLNEENLLIAGHVSQETREKAILEEYNLISLDDPKLKETKDWIERLYQAANTDNDIKIKLFLTCSGVTPIQIVYGLTSPAIAIHQDYLEHLAWKDHFEEGITDEAIFSMAWSILYIKHFPLSGNEELTELQSSELDVAIIKQFTNGLSAVNYLRYCIEFINKHNDYDDVQRISILSRYHSSYRLSTDSYNKRLKNVTTYLATDEIARKRGSRLPTPSGVLNEVEKFSQYNFFRSRFCTFTSNENRLQFLTQVLPELRTELLPFELTNKPCIRLREFCIYLSSIPTDWSDPNQVAAIDNLIDQAFVQRIPGFDYIYRNALRMKPEKNSYSYATRFKQSLYPLGIFKRLQIAINNFIAAANKADAIQFAKEIMELNDKIKEHLYYGSATTEAMTHLSDFKKEHGGNLPKTEERYFGSTVGKYVAWHSFNDNTPCADNDVPWAKYFAWVDPADNDLLPKVLWRLGVVRDRRLLTAFSETTLCSLALDKKNDLYARISPLVTLAGKYAAYGAVENGMTIAIEMIIDHLASQHNPDFSMYDNHELDTEAKFKLFYDRNKLNLVAPTEKRNSNNPAVRHLIDKFAAIMLNGTEEEKKLVKGFFMSRDDHRDFASLLNASRNYHYVKNMPLYTDFYLEQKYQDKEIELFNQEEAVKAYRENGYEYDKVNPYIYMRMFGLKEREFNLNTLLKLIPLLLKEHLNNVTAELIVQYLTKHPCTLLSPEFLSLSEYCIQIYDRKSMLQAVMWNLPESYLNLAHIDINKLIILYRAYDEMILFPSFDLHKKFGRLILDKIRHIATNTDQINALESLLFVGEHFYLAITDLDIRKEAIELWCKAVRSYYGEDDGSQAYYDKMKPLVDKVISKSSNRDMQMLLVRFTESISSQHMLSEYIGIKMEPQKYIQSTNKSIFHKSEDVAAASLALLARVSELLTENANDQKMLLNYLAESLSPTSSRQFAEHLSTHPKLEEIASNLNFTKEALKNINYVEMLGCVIYHLFWDRPIEQRSLAMNYLLIPPDKMATKALCDATYEIAFEFVVNKLFPQGNTAGTDDHLAKSFLKAYLDSADEYSRGYLLSGMLVASNEGHGNISVGKKLVLLCEHMGPAYVKLAQAIHSYPGTPAHIREDLKHIKGRANPPTRWQLCRMIDENLTPEDRKNIKSIGRLLGSASYNLALEVELQDGSRVVLLLLRENAAKQAHHGFAHLTRAIEACGHPRVRAISDTAVSLIQQAKDLSLIEMNQEKSALQYKIAAEIYQHEIHIGKYKINIHPSKLYKSGKGYRFIEQIHGEEFNNIVMNDKDNPVIKLAAEAIVAIELQNIFRGGHFDSDRHGNQLRIKIDKTTGIIDIGLYDFGEMSLEKPTDNEIMQFVNVLNSIDYTEVGKTPFAQLFENELSKHIETLHKRNDPAKYLMHIRKGILALQDFYQHVPTERLVKILLSLAKSNEIHPILNSSIAEWTNSLACLDKFNSAAGKVSRWMSVFYSAAATSSEDMPLEIKRLSPSQPRPQSS